LLERRVAKTREEIAAHRAEQKADGRQLVLIEEEITAKRELVEKGLERRPRLLALQRQQAALEGSIGNRVALVARAEQSIAEITFQRHGLLDEREAEIEAALADTRDQISQIKDRLTIANDNLMHSKIRAPNDGKVYGMRFHTVGGVIPPREIILGIVPVDDSLNIQVRIDPADIDVVKVGSLAMVRLTSFSQRTFKPIEGELVRISADVVADSVTGPYYEGEIILNRDRLADQPDLELLQGMPAMAIISTGDQTMLEYLMAPILRSIDTSLREN
jgi:HlyD family secretion protein/epimerase transport system membrane fusion protein